MDAPRIRSYLNVHLYLQDLYSWRKKQDSKFSYESWSQELGLKSRSFLRMVVMGKRPLTESFTSLFTAKMNFEEIDEQYFRALVGHGQSRSAEQKKIYERTLIRLLRYEGDRTEIENYLDFLSSPLLPKIQTLLSFDDIVKTARHLSELCNEEQADVEMALQRLASLGLARAKVEHLGEAVWESNLKVVKVPAKFGDSCLKSYHSACLQNAIDAQNLPAEVRRFRSLLFAMSPDEFTGFLKEFEEFIQFNFSRLSYDTLRDRRLYQINFNVFPVTETPAREGIPEGEPVVTDCALT